MIQSLGLRIARVGINFRILRFVRKIRQVVDNPLNRYLWFGSTRISKNIAGFRCSYQLRWMRMRHGMARHLMHSISRFLFLEFNFTCALKWGISIAQRKVISQSVPYPKKKGADNLEASRFIEALGLAGVGRPPFSDSNCGHGWYAFDFCPWLKFH